MENHKIHLIITDDHQIFLDGVLSLLQNNKEIVVDAVASDGNSLLDAFRQSLSDLIILDISMPGISGIDIIPLLKEIKSDVKILILSMHTQDEYVFSALQAGANGFLAKQNTSRTELYKAIKVIFEGQEYYSPGIINTIKESYLKAVSRKPVEPIADNRQLTKRELEILKHVVEGFSNTEIADRLSITIRTVETHKTNILQKLNLRNSVELVKYAIRNELL